ncbi:hypothetical protein AAG906_005306 [Vitis piasezkii]
MLKSDVRTASQQVLVINHLAKNDKMGDSKPSNQLRQSNRRRDGRQQQERINFVQRTFAKGSVRPINGIITFPPINANQVLQPHEDALILTLGVGKFDVRRILVDLDNSIDLLQMLANKAEAHLLCEQSNGGY